VLTSTIDQFCYISLRRRSSFLDSKYRISWSQTETVDRVEDIQHAGVRGCLQYLGIEEGLEISHAGDLPARSGLGSSSAFTVGMLNALHILRGESVSRADLAREAIEVEQEVLQETVGIQDQIECAWGGLNLINFDREGRYSVEPVWVNAKRRRHAEEHLLLMFTGLQRHASEIAAVQVDNVEHKKRELRGIVDLVIPAAAALSDGNMMAFGKILHQAWMFKRELSDKISSEEIDMIYEHATGSGAWGGKVLGAGGGGFMLFVVPPSRRRAVIDGSGRICVPFKFEHSGSQVVLYG
jgi:D-glycero-alpha-D-manno-heptose-7-phosphate kinase